ncbi:MAG: heparinase, partial [Cyclobacterium sp.]
TYTRKTFSDERYSIWYNRSDHHNLPSINGFTQLPGSKYRATNVSHKAQRNSSTMALDIGQAYPENAGIASWKRVLKLDRGKKVTVNDDFQLTESTSLVQHLMTIYPARVLEPGKLSIPFEDAEGNIIPFELIYDAASMVAEVEKIALTEPEDKGIEQKWGDTIYRINFEYPSVPAKGKSSFVLQKP